MITNNNSINANETGFSITYKIMITSHLNNVYTSGDTRLLTPTNYYTKV